LIFFKVLRLLHHLPLDIEDHVGHLLGKGVKLLVVVAARVMDVIAMLTQQEIAQYQVAQD